MQKSYIVTARSNQVAKNGSHYANLKIAAQKGESLTISVWDLEENEGPHIEDIIMVDMDTIRSIKFPKKADFGGFRNCRHATPDDPLYQLIPRPIDKAVWDLCINNMMDNCSDTQLMDFIQQERDNLYEQYSNQTAATSLHHAFKGGLLNHTYELLHMLEGLYPTLPPLKLERCIIAILFHDYGKLKEYDENMEGTKYMYLMGHTYISAHVLHNKLNASGISNEEKMALVRRQIDESIDRIDEYRGILHIRRHLAATPLFKGIRNFRPTRIAMLQADTREQLDAILDHIENDILPNIDNQSEGIDDETTID